MRRTAVYLVCAVIAVMAVPLVAQSIAGDSLAALIAEVRLLRIAVERSAEAPQMQLLGTRLTVQNQRLQEAARAHAAVQNELQEALTFEAERGTALQRLEEQLTATQGPERAVVEQQIRQLRLEVSAQGSRAAQLRPRESELAAVVAAEQNQWLLMNQRLDELERALKPR